MLSDFRLHKCTIVWQTVPHSELPVVKVHQLPSVDDSNGFHLGGPHVFFDHSFDICCLVGSQAILPNILSFLLSILTNFLKTNNNFIIYGVKYYILMYSWQKDWIKPPYLWLHLLIIASFGGDNIWNLFFWQFWNSHYILTRCHHVVQ